MARDIPARLLVVDDSLTVRRFCCSIAESLGVEVVEAANGVEGLERGLSQPFGLMLVDLNMPTMDGLRFLREARRQPELADVPAILISTSARPDDRHKAFAAGANFYHAKPVDADWLARVMTLLLKEARHV
ncbi:response regulator [Rhodobacter sp. Har01]|uniref:response regulator n=1 Tax=Rhodobacter sp. Har01 TaxID=2883999 RepID=UPI001D0691FD|nr:response regulator [Rhodobacter sp. Har01]MCB6179270.1 response regulator [Rhodobacter sp. Har01]